MPFGKQDCDMLYDRQIYPVLRKLNISPIRVDQREHKEDLNVYIIRMLNESDIALADLTYARPSVYYEAGYAESKIPIVYTARKDHLSRAQTDDNLRVHFDLEMKKIIHWRDVDDPSFGERLMRRVSYIIKPICQQREKDELLDKDRKTFTSQSVLTRIEEIKNEFKNSLEDRRFWICSLREIYREFADRFMPGEVLIGSKLVKKTCHFCVVTIVDSLTIKHIRSAVKSLTSAYLISSDYEIEKYKEYYYFLSLHKFLESRLASILPTAASCGSSGTYLISDSLYINPDEKQIGRLNLIKPAPGTLTKIIKIISPIDTMLKLREEAKYFKSDFSNEKSNRFAYFYRGRKIKLSTNRAQKE
jgi:hypothetical protein